MGKNNRKEQKEDPTIKTNQEEGSGPSGGEEQGGHQAEDRPKNKQK